jgi:DNA-binding response OmpR family regulator
MEVAMSPQVLFADDESDIRELVQLILEAAGFRVHTTDNAADVLRLVRTEHFDVLLLDYWMRDETGIELCRQIRAFDQSTPILICSGAVTRADREAAVRAGAQGYVVKPFVSADLIRALRSVVKDANDCPEQIKSGATGRSTSPGFFPG